MILPLLVDDLQHDVALDPGEDVARDDLFLLGVLRLDPVPQRVAQLAGVQLVELDGAVVVVAQGEELRQLALQGWDVPIARVILGARELVHPRIEELLGRGHHVAAAVGDVLLRDVDVPLQDFAAQRVDALTLLVHHVVVLEQVLADREVLAFHLPLRPLDGPRHHAMLDGDALFHAQPLHQAGDAVRAEDAHQVVFEREVEARRARIALAAGAAAKLVVDAARLVALGADDVQAAERYDVLVLVSAQLPEVAVDAVPVRRLQAVEAVDHEEVDELLVVDVLLLALHDSLGDAFGNGLLTRHVLGVAAEQDVGAAAGHVGGDRDPGPAARLGDDLGFLRVILGVEHDVLDAALLEHPRQALRLLD